MQVTACVSPADARVQRAVIGALVLAAFAVRCFRLDAHALWWDEGISAFLANQDLGSLMANRAADVHPPLYFLVLKAWVQLVGTSPYSLRFFSVGAGTATVAATYALGRRMTMGRCSTVMSVRMAFIAAAVVAASPYQVHHSQEARMYAALTLLASVATYVLLDRSHVRAAALRARASGLARAVSSPAVYGGLLLGALYTHYYAALLIAAHAAYMALWRRSRLWSWCVVVAVAVTGFAPWLLVVAPTLAQVAASKVALDADSAWPPFQFAVRYAAAVTVGYDLAASPGFAALTAMVLAALAFLAFQARRFEAPVAAVYVGVPIALGYLVHIAVPFDAFPRLLGFAAPGLYILSAMGLAALWRHRPAGPTLTALSLAALAVPLVALFSESRHAGEDYRPLIRRMDDVALASTQRRPARGDAAGPTRERLGGDVAVLDFPWQSGYLAAYGHSAVAAWLAPGTVWAADNGRMASDLRHLRSKYDRIWYVVAAGLGGRRGLNIEGNLVRTAYPAIDEWFGANRLLLFGTHSPGPVLPRTVAFGDSIRLTGAAVPRSVGAGDVLPLTLRWRATGQPSTSFKVFVHLLDRSRRIVAQRDAEPVAGLRPTDTWSAGEVVVDRLGVLVPAGTASGPHRLEVGLYEPATGRRLPIVGTLPEPADRLQLGVVDVVH